MYSDMLMVEWEHTSLFWMYYIIISLLTDIEGPRRRVDQPQNVRFEVFKGNV